jgi:hypothetical protein
MKAILCAVALLGSFVSAQSEPVANDITCAEAKVAYKQNEHIYTRINTGQLIPIYGLQATCPEGHQGYPLYVQTTDVESCRLGYRCN